MRHNQQQWRCLGGAVTVQLGEGEARSLFSETRVARLATADALGQPHVVPVTFALEDDMVYIAVDHKPKTTANLKRLRNITVNPLVSLLADRYVDNWDALWWARADGRAQILAGDAAQRHPVDLLVAKYSQYGERRPEGPVISIVVTRWSGWAASPGAVRDTPWTR